MKNVFDNILNGHGIIKNISLQMNDWFSEEIRQLVINQL